MENLKSKNRLYFRVSSENTKSVQNLLQWRQNYIKGYFAFTTPISEGKTQTNVIMEFVNNHECNIVKKLIADYIY